MHPDEQAIRDLVKNWFAATKAGDIPTILSLMADDVLFLVSGKPPFGKSTFAAASSQIKDLKFEGTSEILDLQIAGEWAWMRTHIHVTVTPPDGKTVARSGSTLTILRKTAEGRWVIFRDANLLAPGTR